MAKKSDSTDKVIKNNPLSIVLGIYLSRERNKLPDNNSSKEIAQKIGFTGISFYRMIEAGLANLHPSKVLDVLKAFPLSNMNLDAFCKYLVAVQLIETSLNSYAEFNDAIYQLSVADEKLKKLFGVLQPAFKEIEKNPKEFKDAFNSENYYYEIKEYFSNYEQYGKNALEIQKDYPNRFFKDFPTIFKGFLEATKQNLTQLPINYDFRMSWNWEEKNKTGFKKLMVIGNHPHLVASKENLSRYHYPYLWEKEFEVVNFIFLDTSMTPEKIEADFNKYLKSSLEIANKKEWLSRFKEATNKIAVKTISSNNSEVLQMLEKTEEVKGYDAVWIFEMKDGFSVGVKAIIDSKSLLLTEGIYLNYSETLEKLKIFEKLWTNN